VSGSPARRLPRAEPAGAREPEPLRERRRPWAFVLHSLLGLKLSLFVFFVCATGTLAVVSEELEWLVRPLVRASGSGPHVSWGRQYAAASAAYPEYTIDYAEAGEGAYLANRFFATDAAGAARIIYVDGPSGAVKGESGWLTVGSFLRALHYLLFTPGDWGFFLVTPLGFVLLGSLVTGLLTYKRFWRGLARLPRRGRSARMYWGDLHRLAALWSTAFVLLVSATALWYFAERLLYRAGIDVETQRVGVVTQQELDRLGPQPPRPLALDELVAIAQRELPGLRVSNIWFPLAPEEPIFIRGQAAAWLVRERANGVELAPYTGQVLAVHRADVMPVVERVANTADPLHFGDFGGLISKLAWVAFGSLLCLTALSGVAVYIKRLGQSGLRWGLGFLGRWKWLNLALVAALPAAAYWLSWAPNLATPAGSGVALEASRVGPWQVQVRLDGEWPPSAGASAHWNVRFCAGCFAQLRRAELAFGDESGPVGPPVRLYGVVNALPAELVVPESERERVRLWLTVQGWQRAQERTSWPLPRGVERAG
jgi:uncharacterized iron-regulated membrane protein